MIWGCVSIKGIGTLTNVEGNINARKYIEILDNNLWPVIARHFPDNQYVFMDGNAPVHRANLVKEYIANNNIITTPRPAQPPDLNIIENNCLK
jgi:transposase